MNETTKYTIYGALFGCCFPIGSIVFLYFMGEVANTSGVLPILAEAHQNSLLWVIDTAPLFLGLFARLAGVRQDRILQFAASLEQQVAVKTESLRLALEESREANEMIAHMAEHDSLTGLLNRRRFQKELDKWGLYAQRYQRGAALLFIDLDKFKFVNILRATEVSSTFDESGIHPEISEPVELVNPRNARTDNDHLVLRACALRCS